MGRSTQRDTSELPFGQVAQAWAEAEAKQGAESEDVIRGAAGIRIVRVDLQQRAMVQQPVEDVRRLVVRRRHNLDAVGVTLIGKVGVKADAGIVPIASVDIAGGIAALGRAKELPVG